MLIFWQVVEDPGVSESQHEEDIPVGLQVQLSHL